MIDQQFVEAVSKTTRGIGDISQVHDFAQSYSHSQIKSKLWLVEHLYENHSPKNICIIGSWYATVLPYLLRHTSKITCFDADPHVHNIANEFAHNAAINSTSIHGRMESINMATYDTVINTSCEHMPDMKDHIVSAFPVYALQSNNYHHIPEHTNCKNSLDEFIESTGLNNIYYADTQVNDRYERYMVIGTL